MTKNPLIIQKQILKRIFSKVNRRRIAIYSAFPKSASQHLINLIKIGTDNKTIIVSAKTGSGWGHNIINEEKIYLDIPNYFKHKVLYGHFPFSAHNNHALKTLAPNSNIIVSIRPLPDVVISYKEHIDRKGFGPLDLRIIGASEGNQNWNNLDDNKKYDYIINFVIPWYIRYIMGWLVGAKEWPLRIITFEEHTLFPYKLLESVSDFLKIQITATSVKEKVSPKNIQLTNYNVGRMGRGRQILSREQLITIQNILSFFGESILDSNIGKYLLHGYDGLKFDVTDVVNDYTESAVSCRFSTTK